MTITAPGNTILVFGMPRSGTTWLGKLLDSHPSVLYRHEPDSWSRLTGIPLVALAPYSDAARHEVRSSESSMISAKALKVCGKTPIFPKSYLSSPRLFLYRMSVRLSQLAAGAGLELPVFAAPGELASGVSLVWKSIESVGRLGLALDALPRSRAILLIRHPCGYIASVLRGESQLRFEDNRRSSEDYGILEQLLVTPLAQQKKLSLEFFRELSPEERLAWRWVLYNDLAIRDAKNSGRCAVIRYEDVCYDPVEQMQEHFAFAGLDWPRQTESFIEKSTGKSDDAYYSVFRDSKLAAVKWRQELAPEVIERILNVVSGTAPGSLYRDADDTEQA